MRRTDHILILTRALLTASEKEFLRIHSMISEMYTLNENRKPLVVSLGVQGYDNEETFTDWAHRAHQEKVKSLTFFYHAYEHDVMPPHKAAAFAGVPDLLVQITTGLKTSTYTLVTFRSADYEITPEDFIILLDSQQTKERMWALVTQLIVDSNQLNDKRIFEVSETRSYLTTPEGRDVFAHRINTLVQEIQVECTLYNESFIIPNELQSHFTKPKTSFFSTVEQKDYVYLYPVQDVSAADILTLIEAQDFPSFWEKLNHKITQDSYTFLKAVSADVWPGEIQSMDQKDVQDFAYYAGRTICEICEENNLKPVIPKSLVTHFGPSEEDQKRAAARAKSESTRWALEYTKNPWEYYAFCEVQYNKNAEADTLVKTYQAFKEALVGIHIFAKDNQSPFEEAFHLAHLVLTQLHAGAYDEAHIGAMKTQLRDAGFSERAVTVFEEHAGTGVFLKSLGCDDQYIHGVLAVFIADVFGGMGSWNDQYFEHDQQKFEALSAALFDATKKYFVSLLSWRKV